MRSIKEYIGSDNRLYGREFRYFDGELDYSLVFKISPIPNGSERLGYIDNETHCWIRWEKDGYIGGVEYTWKACRDYIKNGIWVLI